MTDKPIIKKPRNPRHVWKTFFQIARGESFFIGRFVYVKTSFITASGFFVAPWRHLRTTTLVRSVKSSVAPRVPMIPGYAITAGQRPYTLGANGENYNRIIIDQVKPTPNDETK